LPAVIIRPARPYTRPAEAPCTVTWRLIVGIWVPLEDRTGLDATDELLGAIVGMLRSAPYYAWIETSPALVSDELSGVAAYRTDVIVEVST
jgi:hypothetical protein